MGRSTKIRGDRLKKRRDELSLTQAQLGELIDGRMSDENIGRIERGTGEGILTKHLPKLAAALQMPLDQLKRELVAPADARASGIERLWRRLFAAVDAIASAKKTTRRDVLDEALRLSPDWKISSSLSPVATVPTPHAPSPPTPPDSAKDAGRDSKGRSKR